MGINKFGMKFGVLLLLAALVTAAGELRAAPLGLAVGSPNIESSFITTDYSFAAQLLTASGFAQIFDPGNNNIAGGSFDIDATIDSVGNALGGTLSIGGTIAVLGFNSGTLLTGTLSAFGFPGGGGDPLEFLFSVTGGDAAGNYGGIGATAGVILTNSGFGGSFASDFSGGAFQSLSDTFGIAAVPEPSSLSLFLLGLCLCGVILSWRRRSTIAID